MKNKTEKKLALQGSELKLEGSEMQLVVIHEAHRELRNHMWIRILMELKTDMPWQYDNHAIKQI